MLHVTIIIIFIRGQDEKIEDDPDGLLPMNHQKRKPGEVVAHKPELVAMGKFVSACTPRARV